MPKSRLVGTLLSPALNLWLRSQSDTVESLTVEIKGSDRQILSGHIPGVELMATGAVYQGLHLAHLQMMASSIRVNIGQVVRGKSLQLLESIEVGATVTLSNDDLQQSVDAPLLANALVDVWQTLADVAPELKATWAIAPTPNPSIDLGDGYLDLGMDAVYASEGQQRESLIGQPSSIHAEQMANGPMVTPSPERMVLRTAIDIIDGHCLQLRHPRLLIPQVNSPQANSPNDQTCLQVAPLEGFRIDLGTDVNIQSLAIASEHLQCQGQIWVHP